MIRVGAVNIDTSHPLGFGEVMEKGDRARYVGVFNDSFRDDKEVDGFIRRFGLEKRCQTLDELADMCDICFIHGCDWDDHLRCMVPFLRKGKPVFVDKPLVGNLADCQKIRQLVKEGTVILGASSARYAFEIQRFLAIPEEERGRIVNVFGTVGVDEFNYGIHIAEAIGGLIGSGAESVRHAGRGETDGKICDTYHVRFSSGQSAVYNTFEGTWQPFVIVVMTTKNTYHFKMDSNKLYEALLEQICNYMEGKPHTMADTASLIESVEVMLAGLKSKTNGGQTCKLCELTTGDPSFNGGVFWEGYGKAASRFF